MAAWEQSLQELVRTRGTALVGYAYLLCGDRREAEDLVQDALVKTYARGVPQPDVPHPGALRGRGVRAAVPAAGRHRDPCLLYTSPSPRDGLLSRMPSSA